MEMKKLAMHLRTGSLYRNNNSKHITYQIISQRQRLERVVFYSGNPIDVPVSQKQDALRSKMKIAERNFIQTQYSCSVYLSSFLGNGALALQNS
jgi:hypothetical protein